MTVKNKDYVFIKEFLGLTFHHPPIHLISHLLVSLQTMFHWEKNMFTCPWGMLSSTHKYWIRLVTQAIVLSKDESWQVVILGRLKSLGKFKLH